VDDDVLVAKLENYAARLRDVALAADELRRELPEGRTADLLEQATIHVGAFSTDLKREAETLAQEVVDDGETEANAEA
jgi:hypothetical protein